MEERDTENNKHVDEAGEKNDTDEWQYSKQWFNCFLLIIRNKILKLILFTFVIETSTLGFTSSNRF